MAKQEKKKELKGQKAFLEAAKKEGAKFIKIEGYTYVYGADGSLIPSRGLIAHKSDFANCEKSSASAWVTAVKLLNGVE